MDEKKNRQTAVTISRGFESGIPTPLFVT